MAITGQPNEETQELIKLFHQNKRTLLILSYNELTDEGVIPVLNIFATCESSHERSLFSISDAKDVTASLISVSSAVQNPKQHENSKNSVLCLRRFMKTYNVDHAEDSYQEGLQFTQDEATDVSLKQGIRFLEVQGSTQSQIQQSLALHRKVLKEDSYNIEHNMIPKPALEAQVPKPFGYTFPVLTQYSWT